MSSPSSVHLTLQAAQSMSKAASQLPLVPARPTPRDHAITDGTVPLRIAMVNVPGPTHIARRYNVDSCGPSRPNQATIAMSCTSTADSPSSWAVGYAGTSQT